MKLRSRPKVFTDHSSNFTAPALVLPPNIIRLQTPPISERSIAGSSIASKDRLSNPSSSMVDVSDAKATVDSVSLTKDRRRRMTTVPAAPLTSRNLAKYQEEIDVAVENAYGGKYSRRPPTPAPTPTTRLIQARNFLKAENKDSYPGFPDRIEQIEHYLRDIPKEERNIHPSIYHEAKGLLRSHKCHVSAGGEPPLQRRQTRNVNEASRPIMSLLADNEDPEEEADPFEWTNKLDNVTYGVRQSPTGGKQALAVSDLRKLARPLNGGRLRSLDEAYRLIDEQKIRENHENKNANETNHDQLLVFEKNLSPTAKGGKFSLERWSGHSLGGSSMPAFKLGEGSLMPQEMMDIDWDRDRSKLEESLVGYENVDEGEAQLLFAETPFLQALMSEQIERDLATSIKKGKKTEPVARKPAVLMTQRFALPRPAQSKIDEAVGIAKSLNIQADPPTPSPRTALFRKRKFEQFSDSETDEEERGDWRLEPPAGGTQGERGYVDEAISSVDSLFDGSVGGVPEMSGALQDLEGDDLHLYPDDD